jgi:hypothetical protein
MNLFAPGAVPWDDGIHTRRKERKQIEKGTLFNAYTRKIVENIAGP